MEKVGTEVEVKKVLVIVGHLVLARMVVETVRVMEVSVEYVVFHMAQEELTVP